MIVKLATAVISALILPALALAGPGPLQGACREDVKALCGSIQAGGGRLRDCMKEHRAQLSNTCKISIADRMLERSTNKAASGSSIKSPINSEN